MEAHFCNSSTQEDQEFNVILYITLRPACDIHMRYYFKRLKAEHNKNRVDAWYDVQCL